MSRSFGSLPTTSVDLDELIAAVPKWAPRTQDDFRPLLVMMQGLLKEVREPGPMHPKAVTVRLLGSSRCPNWYVMVTRLRKFDRKALRIVNPSTAEVSALNAEP